MESSNSAGLLSGLDGPAHQAYVDIAALETVSEDQEAMGGAKLRTTGTNSQNRQTRHPVSFCLFPVLKEDSMDRFSDYYFRDSFEHSSSESQLIDNNYRGYEGKNPSHRSSRSQTPQLHSQIDGRICLPNVSQNSYKNSQKNRKFNIIRAFVPSFMIVTVIVLVATIIMLETDCEFFGKLRHIPEMISLRHNFYEPVKQYLRNKLSVLF